MTSKSDLIVNCLTCGVDTNGLFDFESKGLFKQTFKLKPRDEDILWELYLFEDKIHIIEGDLAIDFASNNPSASKILLISYTGNQFHLQSPQSMQDESSIPESEIIWIVHSDSVLRRFNCKNRSHNSYKLNENDILKFGRIQLSVKCIIMGSDVTSADLNLKGLGFINPDNQKSNNLLEMNDSSQLDDTHRCSNSDPDDMIETDRPCNNEVNDSNKNTFVNSKSFGNKLCRICLCDEVELGPLVAPCNCKGSLNYVHLSCLRTWIKGRLSNSKGDDVSFFWKELACELCGIQYPSVLNINDIETNLMDIKRPETPYIVLEMSSNSNDGCFVVSVAKNKAIIGRSHESDIRLTDISVSRRHASIELVEGNIVIQDRQSKFGTLVKAQTPFSIPIKGPICLQIGRSTIMMNIKDPWSLKWPSCLRAENISEKNNIVNIEC